MGRDHTLKNVSSFDEGCLIRSNQSICNCYKSIVEHLAKDLKAAIQETNRSKFLQGLSFWFLRHKSNHHIINSIEISISLLKGPNQIHEVTLNNIPESLIEEKRKPIGSRCTFSIGTENCISNFLFGKRGFQDPIFLIGH